MRRLTQYVLVTTCAAVLGACGGNGDDAVNAASDAGETTNGAGSAAPAVGKPQGPLTVEYRIIGKPVVGQPVAIELNVRSATESQPVDVSYRILDETAMKLADAQPARVTMTASNEEQDHSQRVTIVPLREGRLYLNVSLAVPSADASASTVTAIPIQVGSAPRAPAANGSAGSDENGDAIRALPADES